MESWLHCRTNIYGPHCYGAEQKIYTISDLENILARFSEILVTFPKHERASEFTRMYWWHLGTTEYNEPLKC